MTGMFPLGRQADTAEAAKAKIQIEEFHTDAPGTFNTLPPIYFMLPKH